jgi:hypothetical protein
MRSQWEDITPDRMREELKTASCGRIASPLVIEKYSRDMKNGRWVKSPEAVVYDGEDTGTPVLRDGQQRGYALIKAATELAAEGKIDHPDDFSLRMWVTRGTTAEIDAAFPYLNIGKSRSTVDDLVMRGYRNAHLLHTVARRIALWEAGAPTGNAWKPTKAEILALLEPQEGKSAEQESERIARIIAAADFAAAWNMKPPVPAAGIVGFLWWLLGRVNEQDRDTFLDVLKNGGGGEDLKPVLLLRTRLHRDQYDAQRHGTKVKQETVLWLCLRTWTAWHRDEDMAKLQMPPKLGDASFRVFRRKLG